MRIKKFFILFSFVFIVTTFTFTTQANAKGLSTTQKTILNNLKHSYYKVNSSNTVFVSYNKGKTYVNTHITLTKDTYSGGPIELSDPNVYVSKSVTAIIFIDSSSIANVYVSHDMCKTWTATTIKAKSNDPFTKGGYVPASNDIYCIAFMNFTSSKTGYIVFGGEPAMSQENSYVYRTTNGGKSWYEIPNATDFYEHDITGGGFANHTNGFICYTPFDTNYGPIYATYNSGKTWKPLKMNYPSWYANYNLSASSPRFNGKYGLMPIDCYSNDSSNSSIFYMYTLDYGKTWHYLDE